MSGAAHVIRDGTEQLDRGRCYDIIGPWDSILFEKDYFKKFNSVYLMFKSLIKYNKFETQKNTIFKNGQFVNKNIFGHAYVRSYNIGHLECMQRGRTIFFGQMGDGDATYVRQKCSVCGLVQFQNVQNSLFQTPSKRYATYMAV